MSIQSSQVASIDLSGKPEGATHYSVNRPDARADNWYKLESGKWKFWALKRWQPITGAAPTKEVLQIPAQPDWSKGPSNATHFGPESGPFHKAFFKLVDGSWLIARWENDWFWREYSAMGHDRLAMLIARPQTFSSQVQEGIEDAEAGNLVSLDEVKARWESRPSVPRDFSGPVLDHNPDPEPMTPVEYKSVDGTWKPGVYVGRVYGRMVVGCDETEVVGWLDSEEMRPPRTPEQIAADERLHKIRNAATDIARALDELHDGDGHGASVAIAAMIDAGYARPVKA